MPKRPGMLCVFGRAIRSITICQSAVTGSGNPVEPPSAAGAGQQVFVWEPTEVCPGVEPGRLRLKGHWGAETDTLCVRTGSGDLLLALGTRGLPCVAR
jgi:hypothetical protein